MRALSTLAAMQHRTRTSHLSYIEKPTDERERDHPRCDRVPLLVIYRYKYTVLYVFQSGDRVVAVNDFGRPWTLDDIKRRTQRRDDDLQWKRVKCQRSYISVV